MDEDPKAAAAQRAKEFSQRIRHKNKAVIASKRENADTAIASLVQSHATPSYKVLATDLRGAVGKHGRKDPRKVLEEIQKRLHMGYAPDGRQVSESVGGNATTVTPDKPTGKHGKGTPILHPKMKQALALFPEKAITLQTVSAAAAATAGTKWITPTRMLVWGSNAQHQLGLGHEASTTERPRSEPTHCLPLGVTEIATAWDGLVAASGDSEQQLLPHKHLVALAPIRVATTGCGSVSMAVCASGKLYCWGEGSLIDATITLMSPTPASVLSHDRIIAPTVISGLPARTAVAKVACSPYHAVAITESGSVFVWGDNSVGAVGVGVTKLGRHVVKPRLLPQLSEVIASDVSCGSAHTLLLTSDGAVFAWGDGKAGQLGTGDAKDSPVPVKITNCVHRTLVPQPFNQVDVVYEPGGLPHVSSISAGMNHSLVVTTDGTVYCCGWNEHGRCGFPTSVDDDTVNTFTGVAVPDAVVSAAAGGCHNVALTVDGSVYSWGSNELNQLGYDVTGRKNWSHEPKQVLFGDIEDEQWAAFDCVYAGYGHSAVVTVDGRVWMWGWGEDGQLGVCNENSSQTPLKLTTLSSQRVLSLSLGRSHSLCVVRPDDMSDIAEESEYVVTEPSKPPEFDAVSAPAEAQIPDAKNDIVPDAAASVPGVEESELPVTSAPSTFTMHVEVDVEVEAMGTDSTPSPAPLPSNPPLPTMPPVVPESVFDQPTPAVEPPDVDGLCIEEEPAPEVIASQQPSIPAPEPPVIAPDPQNAQLSPSLPLEPPSLPVSEDVPPLIAASAWCDPDAQSASVTRRAVASTGTASSKAVKRLPRSQSTADVTADTTSEGRHGKDRSESASRRPVKSASQPSVGLPAVRGAIRSDKPSTSRDPAPKPSHKPSVPLPSVNKRAQPAVRRK